MKYIGVWIDGILYQLNDDTLRAEVKSPLSQYKEKHQGEVVIPESIIYKGEKYIVTEIGFVAFSGCSGLTSITIPKSVEEIDGFAFSKCSRLTSITIPEYVTEIGFCAFSGCIGLTSITVAENNVTYDSRNSCNAIIETKSNTLIAGCSTTIIPESVTEIGSVAFEGCKSLTSITIPESVAKIGRGAFKDCSGLTSITVAENNATYDSRNSCNAIIETKSNTLIAGCSTTTIPESVTEIGSVAFIGCSSLTSITIPKSVTKIGRGAFCDCCGLTSITIPESVTNIEVEAFAHCTSLKEIYCYNFLKDWDGAFSESLVGDITIHIPKTLLERVRNSFKKIVPIEEEVKKIELPTRIILPEKSVRLLDPNITPSYATDQRLKWSSSNEEVAVVNSKGRVVALSSGTATIQAMTTDGSEVCASCEVEVRRMVESIQLSNTSISLVTGNVFSLNAIVSPKDAYDTSLTWSTTNDDIAMILGNGRIVAVLAGKATITAKANDGSGVTATCEVTTTEKIRHKQNH